MDIKFPEQNTNEALVPMRAKASTDKAKALETKSQASESSVVSLLPQQAVVADKSKAESHAQEDKGQTSVDQKQAKSIAKKLAEEHPNIRFVVRDLTQVHANNVIIEVVKDNRVVATIPAENLQKLADSVSHHDESKEAQKGMILDLQAG